MFPLSFCSVRCGEQLESCYYYCTAAFAENLFSYLATHAYHSDGVSN